MKVFKTAVDSNEIFELTKENYSLQTEGKEGFSFVVDDKKKMFAICPACNNPVEIVALYSTKRKPHAKHYPHTIEGLAKIDIDSMLACKYFTGKRGDTKKGDDKVPKGKLEKILCATMRDYFDVAISFFEQIVGVKISFQFAQQLLDEWIKNTEWEYFCCTNSTLLFTCLYGTFEYPLYGRKVFIDSPIYKLLKSIPASRGLRFEVDNFDKNLVKVQKRDDINFLKLTFNFDNYKRVVDDYGCIEYMELRVFCRQKSKEDAEIYRRKIKIKSEDWDSFIIKMQNSRDRRFLEIAQEAFKGIDLDLDEKITP